MTDNEIYDPDHKKNWTQLPNILDYMILSPYAIRLYFHMKRRTGASPDGRCWESAEHLAKRCGMSTAMVSKVKQELKKAGLITIEEVPSGKGRKAHNISLVDIWPANKKWFATTSDEDEKCECIDSNLNPLRSCGDLNNIPLIKSQSKYSAPNSKNETSKESASAESMSDISFEGNTDTGNTSNKSSENKTYVAPMLELEEFLKRYGINQPALAGENS